MSVAVSVYSERAYKEYILPSEKNLETSLVLKKELFGLRENAILKLDAVEQKWHFMDGNYRISKEEQPYRGEELKDQDSFVVYTGTGEKLYLIDYEYDEAGRQIVDNGGYDFSNGIFSRVEYRYDGNGRRIEQNEFDVLSGEQIGRSAFSYEGEGEDCVRRDAYDAAGNLETYWTYEYDRDGNRVRETAYSPDGEMEYDWYYEYDKAGNRVHYEAFFGDGTLYETAEWEYDEDGTLIRDTRYDGDGNKISETVFN